MGVKSFYEWILVWMRDCKPLLFYSSFRKHRGCWKVTKEIFIFPLFSFLLENSLNFNFTFSSFQELQFQEQQEELRRELQQRSTQQLLEQSYYDNSNSKNVDFDYHRRTYDKPQLITNLNNLNCQGSNYNTINQSSAKDILYELKQYENFANNSNHQLSQINVNSYVADRQSNNYNGTHYSQNILNYNNSYYKINNYNYIKNQSSSSPSSHLVERENQNRRFHDKYLLNDKMEREETVECSQLVNNNRDANGRKVTIHNFTSNNVTSHTTIPSTHNIMDDDEEQHNNSRPPIHRSQHFTQVSHTNGIAHFTETMDENERLNKSFSHSHSFISHNHFIIINSHHPTT